MIYMIETLRFPINLKIYNLEIYNCKLNLEYGAYKSTHTQLHRRDGLFCTWWLCSTHGTIIDLRHWNWPFLHF